PDVFGVGGGLQVVGILAQQPGGAGQGVSHAGAEDALQQGQQLLADPRAAKAGAGIMRVRPETQPGTVARGLGVFSGTGQQGAAQPGGPRGDGRVLVADLVLVAIRALVGGGSDGSQPGQRARPGTTGQAQQQPFRVIGGGVRHQ